MKIDEIVTLIEAVSRNGLTSLELEDGDTKLSMKKEMQQVLVTAEPQMEVRSQISSVSVGQDGSAADADHMITSPLVGTFYAAPSPDAEPFIKVGDQVKKGQVLGIIEAMKLMNEIECERDGVIEKILIGNEEVVEFGQPLFCIR